MPNYVIGVAIAFVEPVLHAWANIVDNYFSNSLFPRLSTLLFFGTALNILFLPIVFVIERPQLLPGSLVGFVFLIALINIVYQFPYYWALRHADTSIVASLFSLGKITVPIMAFFVIGEQLAPSQYLGFVLIILSATFLTLDLRSLKFNKAFLLMLLVSLVLAFQTILYKYVFEGGAAWASVVIALTLFELLISAAIMLVVNKMSTIAEDFKTIRANWKLFIAQQGLEWGGNSGASFAISVIPVTIAQAIASTQPLFVLLYAVLFRKHFPGFFKEMVGREDLLKKGILFSFIILGTVLVVMGGGSLLGE